jgi:peptidyl-prolyl cis-trans isomerase D
VLIGTLTEDKVPDAAIGEAAFGLASAGQVSEPVQGTFGPVLVRVTAITPEVVKPLAEVSEQIRRDLAVAEASRVLMDVHDSYEDARAGGETLRQAAEKLKLKVVTIDAIDRTGAIKDGTIVKDIPASAELLRAAFEAEANTENAALNSGASGFVFYEVEGIQEVRERNLDEVKDKAIADWKIEQANVKLDEKVKALEQRVKDGVTLDALATELATQKQTKRGLKREANDADFGEAGVAAIFALTEGGVGQTPTVQNDGRMLFKVTEVFEPAGADASTLPEQQRNTLSTGVANDMLEELVSRLRGEFDVEVDRAAAQQAIQLQR